MYSSNKLIEDNNIFIFDKSSPCSEDFELFTHFCEELLISLLVFDCIFKPYECFIISVMQLI